MTPLPIIRVFAALLFSMFFLACDNTRQNSTAEQKIEGSEHEEKKEGLQSGAAKQLNNWFLARAYPEPYNLNKKYEDAWQTFMASRAVNNHPNRTARMDLASWTYIGPFGTPAGRVLCIKIDPANSNNLWAGTASGGIWKSTNAGANWSFVPINNYPVLGVSSIIIDPTNSNIMYAGTGEVYRSGSGQGNIGFNVWKARGTYGVGILKSTDGGTTWTQVLSKNTPDMFAIQMLEFDPSSNTTIYAACTDGLYRTTNSGTSWTKILDKVYVADVVIHPTDPLRISASVGNMVDADKGVYYTTNGGTNWTLATGFPAFNGYIRLGNVGTTLFASMGHGSGNELYSSANFGQTWSVHSNSAHCSGQYWFSHDVAINPFNTDSLMMVGVSGYRYRVSNATRTAIGTVHSDMHDIEYDPVYRGRIYIACDGGIYRSTDGGASWTARHTGLGATQFYASFGVSPTTLGLYIGGLQDNGVSRYSGGTWTHGVVGGDGGPTAFAPNGTTVLTSNDARAVHQSTNSGTSFPNQRLDNLGITHGVDERTGFMAPLAISKSNPSYMYVASDNLHISTNGGNSFTRNLPSSMTRPIEMTNKTAIALAISPTDHQKVFVSTSPFAQLANNSLDYNPPPNVLRSLNAHDDANYTFTSIKNNLPDRFVMDFAISATNDDSIFVVLGGFEDAGGSHIFVTGNGGTTWTDIGTSAILPDVPFNAIAIDPVNPQVLYAGCDFGVYVSDDRGSTWADYNNGMTGTNLIMDLQFNSDFSLIVAATHGRGVLTSPRLSGTLPVYFASFKGIHQSGYNKLEWRTSNEFDLLRFELERSTDGRNFSRVATYQPGNGNGSYTYNHDDRVNSDASGVYFYRVKSIDIDGSFKYSPVISLQVNGKKTFQVLTNPFNNYISISSNLSERQRIVMNLYDAQGKLIKKKEFNGETGSNNFIFDNVYSLPKGIYIIEAVINRQRYSHKLVKN